MKRIVIILTWILLVFALLVYLSVIYWKSAVLTYELFNSQTMSAAQWEEHFASVYNQNITFGIVYATAALVDLIIGGMFLSLHVPAFQQFFSRMRDSVKTFTAKRRTARKQARVAKLEEKLEKLKDE